MKVLGKELESVTDISAQEFRDEIVTELEKCIEIPHAMNSAILNEQNGQQKALAEIIEYLKWSI
jgi:hypothetical protein